MLTFNQYTTVKFIYLREYGNNQASNELNVRVPDKCINIYQPNEYKVFYDVSIISLSPPFIFFAEKKNISFFAFDEVVNNLSFGQLNDFIASTWPAPFHTVWGHLLSYVCCK